MGVEESAGCNTRALGSDPRRAALSVWLKLADNDAVADAPVARKELKLSEGLELSLGRRGVGRGAEG